MARRWTYDRMTSSRPGLSADERKEAERRMAGLVSSDRRTGIVVFTALAVVIVAVITVGPWVGGVLRGVGMSRLASRVVGIGGVALACTTGYLVLCWRLHVRPLRRALHTLGHEVCLGCGYDLHGLGDDVESCPECGHPREPATSRE